MYKCRFQARKWIMVKRTIADLIDENDDLAMKEKCMHLVMDIDRIFRAHADTGCDCWLEAAREAGERPCCAFSIHDAAWLLDLKVKL